MLKLILKLSLVVLTAAGLTACHTHSSRHDLKTAEMMGYYDQPAPSDVNVDEAFRTAKSEPVHDWRAKDKDQDFNTPSKLG